METGSLLQEEAIKSFIGPNAEFYLYNRDPYTPINIFLDFVSRSYKIEKIDFFMGSSPYPDIFILQDDVPCIYYGLTFIERASSLLSLITQFENSETNSRNVYNLALGYLSDFLIAKNEIEIAFRTFVKRSASKVQVYYHNALIDLEMMEYSEYYITIWFFFIAHEFGHFIQERADDKDEYKNLVNPEAVKTAFFDLISESRKQTIRSLMENEADIEEIISVCDSYDKILKDTNLELLQDEIMADIKGVEIIIRFAEPFLIEYAKKDSINFYNLYYYILTAFCSLRFISSCKFTADLASHFNSTHGSHRSSQYPSSFGTRFWFVAMYLAGFNEEKSKDQILQLAAHVDMLYANVIHVPLNAAEAEIVDIVRNSNTAEVDEYWKSYHHSDFKLLDTMEIERFIATCAQFQLSNPYLDKIKAHIAKN